MTARAAGTKKSAMIILTLWLWRSTYLSICLTHDGPCRRYKEIGNDYPHVVTLEIYIPVYMPHTWRPVPQVQRNRQWLSSRYDFWDLQISRRKKQMWQQWDLIFHTFMNSKQSNIINNTENIVMQCNCRASHVSAILNTTPHMYSL